MLPLLPAGAQVLGDRPDLVAREARLWQFELADGDVGVLRRHDPSRVDPTAALALEDVAWLHQFLRRLSVTGFPAPVPLEVLADRSVCVHDGAVWEALSFLPGRPVGWNPAPGMDVLGDLLAAYHDAAESLETTPQRPIALPVAELVHHVSARVEMVLPGWLVELCDELHDRLAGLECASKMVIHGDFTAHNVVSDGEHLGVIDFGLAHVEDSVADLAFGLWRSGRPYQDATRLDDSRVSAFVGGYARRRSLSGDEAAVIPIYLWGRGVQMLVKAAVRGQPPSVCPAQVKWLRDNEDRLSELIASATS